MHYITTRNVKYDDQSLAAGEEVTLIGEWREIGVNVWIATFESTAGKIPLLRDEVRRLVPPIEG